MILDTRNLLADLDELPGQRCTPTHVQALEEAAASRPHIRAIGYWRAADRQCGVGFLQTRALKPPRADRIYDSGVVAWWPSQHTEVGGVPLFLMRFGSHDAAIDPRMLLEIGPLADRQVTLWVEQLRLASRPTDATIPAPDAVPLGVSIDRSAGQVVSRFARNELLPIEVVAIEPLASFWGRHVRTLAAASILGLAITGAWLAAVLSYSRQRLGLAGQLREAIADGRVVVHYQPIMELASGRCSGAEALARWTRDDGDSVPPDVFIPIAESAGLSSDITLAVLAHIVRDLRDWLPGAPDLSVNMNLFPSDLESMALADALAARLHEADLSPGAIKLEITERALLNRDASRWMIQRLREGGHQVAVDDFGTGYSSLSYLQSFELDAMKIDKSFVDAIGTGAATSHVIGHVIEMARSLGLEIVAEGVETLEQRRWLIEHGVQYGQGYLFSPPLSAGAFADFLREGAA